MLILTSQLRKRKDQKALDIVRAREMSKVNALHLSVVDMLREVFGNNEKNCSKAQVLHKTSTSVIPQSFHFGDYELVKSHSKRRHKLQTKWAGQRKIVEAQ